MCVPRRTAAWMLAAGLVFCAAGAAAAGYGDYDADSDVDLDDYAAFAACLGGPGGAVGPGCGVFDFDGDGDVDLGDAACFQEVFGWIVPEGMVLIPPGEFQMGDSLNEGYSDERPRHAVYVSAFCMDRYEVTNQQYADGLNWARNQGNLITVSSGVVYKYNSGTNYSYCDTTSSSLYSRITWNGSTFGVVSGKENHPMVTVTWYGAAAYCNWRSGMQVRQPCYDTSTWACNFSANGYRLPTEAEWEKAARGGAAGRRFPWSDTNTIQHTRANYYSDPYFSYDTSPTRGYHPLWGVGGYDIGPCTSPVGFFTGGLQYKADWGWPGPPTSYQTADGANGYELYDMAGNVWEWCNDWYLSTYYTSSPYNNPRGPSRGGYRVLRGGSWYHSAYYCRSAGRRAAPSYRLIYYGFRCAVGSP